MPYAKSAIVCYMCAIMDKEKDSLRFYYLGKNFENKIEHFGAKSAYLPTDTFIL